MGGLPKLWAEYNTMDGDGNPVDLSHRITEYYYYADGDKTQKVTGHSEKAVLSAEEAARYTVKNVLSGSDGWQPTLLCEACEAPVVKKINATLEWEKVPYAISYVVTAGDEVIGFTEKTSFEVPAAYQNAVLRVQAVNEYGGLSAYGKASLSTGIDEIAVQQRSDDKGWYNMMGMKVNATSKGILIHQHKKIIRK